MVGLASSPARSKLHIQHKAMMGRNISTGKSGSQSVSMLVASCDPPPPPSPSPPGHHGYLWGQREEQHQGTAGPGDRGQLVTLQAHHVHEAAALLHAQAFHQLETHRRKRHLNM